MENRDIPSKFIDPNPHCLICGQYVTDRCLQLLSQSLYTFLVQTGTIQSSKEVSRDVCTSCKLAVELMERARKAQEALSVCFKKKHTNGVNGFKQSAITNQLLTPGNEVNMSGNVASPTLQTPPENDHDLQLVISEVKGGITENIVSADVHEEEEETTEYFRVATTDTCDLPGEFKFDCEIYDHNEVDQLLKEIKIEDDCFELKPTPPHPSISYEMSRWLPTTCASELSFESGCTEDTQSSDPKEKELKPLNGWKCPMCDSKFDSSPDLVEHVHQEHSDNKTCAGGMTCPFCKKQFPTYTQLDDHITKLHGDGSHSCQGCYNVFQRPTLLRRHQQYCDAYKTYQEEQKQVVHKRVEPNKEEVEVKISSTCSICLIMFASVEDVEAHTELCHTNNISKKYNCEGCKAGFDMFKCLYDHQKECMVYIGLRKTSEDSQYSVKFCCQGCNLLIERFQEFQDHKSSCPSIQSLLVGESEKNVTDNNKLDKELPVAVKSEPVESEPCKTSDDASTDAFLDPPPDSSGQGTHTCPECLILYANQQQLDQHTKAVHTNNGNPPYKCTGCQGGFHTKEKQTLHMGMCKRIRPQTASHPCEICLISFEFKSLRDFHMSIHKDAENKQYHCSGCHAGFAAQTHKKSHEQKCGKLKALEEETNAVTSISAQPTPVVKMESNIKSEKSTEVDTPPANQPFKCKVCSIQFSFFCDFVTHSTQCMKQETLEPQVQISKETENVAIVSSGKDMELETKSFSDSKSESGSSKSLDKTHPVCKICGIDIRAGVDAKKYAQRPNRYLERHQKGHDGSERQYHCPGCNWGHLQRDWYLDHVNSCDRVPEMIPIRTLDSKAVNCPVCLINLPNITECELHVNTHHIVSKRQDSYNLLCTGCEGHFSRESQLKAHENDCVIYQNVLKLPQPSDGKSIRCGFCRRVRANWSSQNHKLQYHSLASPKDLLCVNCDEKFNTVVDLIVHTNTKCKLSHCLMYNIGKIINGLNQTQSMETVSTVELGEQRETPNDISDQASLMSDSSYGTVGGSHSCEICGAKDKKKEGHMLIHTEAEKRPFRCDGCGGGFLRLAALRSHEGVCIQFKNRKIFGTPIKQPVDHLNVTPIAPLMTPGSYEVAIDNGGKVSLTCHFCRKQHESEKALVKHLNQHHPLDEPRCDRCDKTFLYAESLTEHKLFCGVNISHMNGPSTALTTQVTSREAKPADDCSDEEEFEEWKCLSCCVKFTDETSFLLHVASHEVSNVNRCHLCMTSFRSAADICMHMYKYHKLYLTTGTTSSLDESFVDSDQEDEDEDMMVSSDDHTPEIATLSNRSPKTSKSKSPVRPVTSSPSTTAKTKTPPSRRGRSEPTKCDKAGPSSSQGKALVSAFNHSHLTGLQCTLCQRSFKSNEALRRHYGIHDGYYSSICLDCGTGFGKMHALRTHKARVHKTPKVNDLVCSSCNGVFMNKYLLERHMEICISSRMTTGGNHQCLLCVKRFNTWHQMKSHVWTHLSKCTFCDEKIVTYKKRVEHMLTCNKNPLKGGGQRSLRTRTAVSYKETTKLDVEEVDQKLLITPLSETFCMKLPAAKPTSAPKVKPVYLPKPLSPKPLPTKFKCPKCSASYTTKAGLKRHMAVHELAEYRCRICGGKFASLLAKNRHMLREHGSRNKIIKAAPRPNPESEPELEPIKSDPEPEIVTYFACEICSKCFHSKAQKEEHVKSEHKPASAKTFDCKICDKQFPSKFARRRHMQKGHQGPSAQPVSLACHICSKRFPSNFAKLQHLKKIHQITDPGAIPSATSKLRICKTCNATFKHKSELRAHRKSEHPHEMGTIDLAPDMFVIGGGSQGSEHKVRQCKLCAAKFDHKSELKAHYRSAHLNEAGNPVNKQPVSTTNLQALAELDQAENDGAQESAPKLSHDLPQVDSSAGIPDSTKVGDTGVTDLVDMKVVNGNNLLTLTLGIEEKKPKIRICKDCHKIYQSKEELKAHRKSEHREKKSLAPDAVFTVSGETLQILEAGGKPIRKTSTASNDVIDLTSDNEDKPPRKKYRAAPSSPGAPAAPVTPAAPVAPAAPEAPAAPVVTTAPVPAAAPVHASNKGKPDLPFKCEHCPKSFKFRISYNQHLTRIHPWLP